MAVAWAEVGMAVYGLMSSGDSQSSANQQNEANVKAKQLENQQNSPFSTSGSRAQYVPMLNKLAMGGPSGVSNDPTYQAMNANSMEDMSRGMAASGQGGSGQAMVALQQNSQQNQMSYWQNMMQQYSSLSGATTNSTAATGQSANDAFNQSQKTQGNVGNAFGLFSQGVQGIYGNGQGK